MSEFLALLPPVMGEDETVVKLAKILDEEISGIDALVEKLLIYSNMENQSEAVIDELARLFHMMPNEGYNLANNIEKKRQLVKSALTLHRHKGTLYAVKEVLKILGVKGKVLEWFEYGGRPYYFKIDAQLGGGISEKDIAVLEALLNEFKNVRSHLEGIVFNLVSEGVYYYGGAGVYGESTTIMPYMPREIVRSGAFIYGSCNYVDERITIGSRR